MRARIGKKKRIESERQRPTEQITLKPFDDCESTYNMYTCTLSSTSHGKWNSKWGKIQYSNRQYFISIRFALLFLQFCSRVRDCICYLFLSFASNSLGIFRHISTSSQFTAHPPSLLAVFRWLPFATFLTPLLLLRLQLCAPHYHINFSKIAHAKRALVRPLLARNIHLSSWYCRSSPVF